ncbi:unnamed protein product [Lactuca virosa]|uniref:Uncharacterized protein n=1 Tax=Lactuca virosa TaxID=75947 RepID=A0AAU9PBM8_9ASTR|nr:unnamed protein product [Lactuca virosa]
MSNGDWVSFSLRHGLVDLCDGLPTSIKYWKEEFLYIHSSAFFGSMAYGAIADRVSDPTHELSLDEILITERLASNFVRWADPDEAVLGMAGMSPRWNHLGKKHMEIFEGKTITLLDRLHRKCNVNPTLVTEEVMIPDSPTRSESNKDSALEVSQSESSKYVPPNLRSKGVKLDSDRGSEGF